MIFLLFVACNSIWEREKTLPRVTKTCRNCWGWLESNWIHEKKTSERRREKMWMEQKTNSLTFVIIVIRFSIWSGTHHGVFALRNPNQTFYSRGEESQIMVRMVSKEHLLYSFMQFSSFLCSLFSIRPNLCHHESWWSAGLLFCVLYSHTQNIAEKKLRRTSWSHSYQNQVSSMSWWRRRRWRGEWSFLSSSFFLSACWRWWREGEDDQIVCQERAISEKGGRNSFLLVMVLQNCWWQER